MNQVTPKQQELSKRQEQIVELLFQGNSIESIRKKLKISVVTVYRDMKVIKSHGSPIPEEITAVTIIKYHQRLDKKFDNCAEDYDTARFDWLEYKDKRGTKDYKFEDEERLRKIYFEASYHLEQALRAIIHFNKSLGIYERDITISTGNTENSVTVVFAPGMKDKKEREVNPVHGKK